MDGRRLTKPIGVEIFRQVTPPGESLSNVFVGVKPWVSISPRDVAHYQHEQEIVYDDRLSSQQFDRSVGEIFSFMVVTLTRGFRGRPRSSDPSNVARAELLDVSPPIQGLRVTQAPQSLNLQWAAPTQSVTGGSLPPLVGYRIYRRQEAHSASEAKLVAEAQKPSFSDTHFQYDQTYSYTVRAVFEKDGYTAETADSAPASITPRNVFPPNPPQGLTAVFTGRSVQLIWKPSLAPDIAGYNVYRQTQGQPPERLNHELLRTPVFSDSNIVQGRQYTYWVTVVNLVHHESLPSQKVTLEAK
jgi:fibronectin type 3 domain-containing protein